MPASDICNLQCLHNTCKLLCVGDWNGVQAGAVVHVVKISVVLCRSSSPCWKKNKNKEIALPVASGLQMLSLQSAWPTLPISRRSNKICKLPFKSLLNLAIYIARAAAIIGWCPRTDIRLYTFTSLVCSLARLTTFSPAWKHWLSTQRLPLLFFFFFTKSLLTAIWQSDSSGDAPCNCCSSFI